MGGSRPVCPVCDSTDYVLRQGQYFCRMCNTQSQELGMETVMDDETVGMGIGQSRTDGITVGKKKRKGKKRSRCEGVRWSTAEGFSWVLRGWVDQLNNIGVDVEVAVLQLWSVYLRELRLGFEKRGEEGMIGQPNLGYREKWNMIGGPPGLLSYQALAAARRKRNKVEQEDEDEEEEEGEETIQEKRRRRKKRKQFFTSVNAAESASEMDPKSPAPSSGGGEGGGSASGGFESEDDFSESGYITDPCLLSRVMERFTSSFEARQVRSKIGKGPGNYPNSRYSGVEGAHVLPSVLNMNNIAALLTLAVISRPQSSITISDMVRLFNSEGLAWRSTLTFLPPAYAPTSSESRRFQGANNTHMQVFTTKMLSTLVFRLASFLYQPHTVPKQINLVYSLPRSDSKRKAPFTFKTVLARFLMDLSLPTVLCKDIYSTFKRLHLTNISATLHAYTPDYTPWASMMFPLVSKRILALILFTLKYHCGLDDQYEVFLSHNINKMASLPNGSDFQYFDLLSWIRLSKVRLDQLMSTSQAIRDQYQSLAHVGTPDLVLPSLISRLRVEDTQHQGPGGLDKPPDKKFGDLVKLMSDLTVAVKPGGSCNLSLEPLIDESKLLLQNGAVKPAIKKHVNKLLGMTEANMRLCFAMESCTLRSILHNNHGVSIDAEFRHKMEKKINLAKNWEASPDNCGTRVKGRFVKKTQSKYQFMEMVMSGRTRKSKFKVPNPKSRPHKFFKLNKFYWFAHQFTMSSIKGGNMITDEALVTAQMLDNTPSNFSWILKYFSCYAQLPPLDLLEELTEIEKLFLMLDPEYFGFARKSKEGKKFVPWKGGKVQVAP
eukprot:GFUD01025043.1.p1 GENE.GFUD01025043.1~~GFUD01025043.1.p1  ORF type:complete len:846 (+),score=217.32 GFUD01025043.1:50-2539(+)